MLRRYVNQPEPELQGSSVTLKATQDRIRHMHREADQIWPPELAQLMKVHTSLMISLLVCWASLATWVEIALFGCIIHILWTATV